MTIPHANKPIGPRLRIAFVILTGLIIGAVAGEVLGQSDQPSHGVTVVDGDTFDTPQGRVRLYNWDAPETRLDWTPGNEKHSGAQCPEEKALGKLAAAYAKELIENAKEVLVELNGRDCNHNRPCGDLVIDGELYSEVMAAAGYARPWLYDAGGERPDWCQKRKKPTPG